MKLKNLLLAAVIPGLILAACSAPEPSPPADAGTETSDAPADAPAEGSGTIETPPAETDAAPAGEPAASAEKEPDADGEWISLFNGKDLEGWTPRGDAVWEVKDGVMIGRSPAKQGHIYAGPELTDLEVKGMFNITEEGKSANSGLYFRANPPKDNVDGYPEGYEAQICNSQEAHTGWLWKPGKGVGKASKLLTKDGEWFAMRVKAVGPKIEIFINDELVTTYEDTDYTKGYFAIQCHNSGMLVEAKELFYRDLSK